MDKRKLYKTTRTVLEMMEDRGYTIPDDYVAITYNDYLTTGLINMTFTEPKTAYIYFHNESKNLSKSELQEAYNWTEEEMPNLIIISHDLPSSALRKELLNPKYQNLEFFEFKHLTYNVARHELQPNFRLLTEEEKREILDRYSLKVTQLPAMLVDMPIARYYSAKKGDVFEIIRRSESAGESIIYRYIK